MLLVVAMTLSLLPVTAFARGGHNISSVSYRTDGNMALSSLMLSTTTAPAGETVTLTVNIVAGEKLTEQQEVYGYQILNGFFALYYDDSELRQLTIQKSGDLYSFVMPDGDVAIYAFFDCIDYSVTVDEPTYGSLSVDRWVIDPTNGEYRRAAAYSPAQVGDKITIQNDCLFSSDKYIVTGMTYTYTENGEEKTECIAFQNIEQGNVLFYGEFVMPASDVRISITYQGSRAIRYSQSAALSLKQEKWSEVVGETVTLTPYIGYDVTSVSVKCGEEYVGVTKNANGTFTFTMPDGDVEVSAEYTHVYYYVDRYWSESTDEVVSNEVDFDPTTFVPISPSSTVYTNRTDTMFVVGDTTFVDRWTINGDIKLIIADGATITCEKGICLTDGNTLHIYGQTNDSGKLIIDNVDDYMAGIGTNDQDDGGNDKAGTLIIHGGTIDVTGGDDSAGIGGGNEAHGGTVTIYGGTVTAHGGWDGAGIGGGDEAENGAITIYGGTVIAKGGPNGAGIGNGGYAGTGTEDIKIYGGTIKATGGSKAAGIGGGFHSGNGAITIYGGTVTAQGGKKGAGIGAGEEQRADSETITIYGGTVTANGGEEGAGIGGGKSCAGGNISIHGGSITSTGGELGAGIGEGSGSTKGNFITIDGGIIEAYGGGDGAGIGGGSGSNTKINVRISGGTVYAYGGDRDLEHYNAPHLGSNGGAAGIGAGSFYYQGGDFVGSIIISGGEVHAYSSAYLPDRYIAKNCGGAGIGSGYFGNLTGTIEITGGVVEAVGKYGGAPIGAGVESFDGTGGECEGTVKIKGGTVTLTMDPGYNCASIGHGKDGSEDGTLELGINMKAYRSGYTPVLAVFRASLCRSTCEQLIITECYHPDNLYYSTEEAHLKNCPYCYTTFTQEEHTFDDCGKCTICGYQGEVFTISFAAGDSGSGSMPEQSVVPGNEYILPGCGFTASEGIVFKAWSVVIGEGTAVIKNVGDTITVTGNTTVTAVWEVEQKEPEFKSHQMILSGQLGMHFYMSIPEGMTDGTMTFKVGDRTVTAAGTLQNNGRYRFTCYVNSVEMAEEIEATYSYEKDGETKTVTDSISVKEYLEVIINNESGVDAFTAATPLAKAIYNYGYYTMKAVPGGSKHPAMPDTYTGDVTLITSLTGYSISATLDKTVIKSASYSLDLESETAINFYLTTDSELTKDNVSVTAEGADFEYTVEKVGSRYRVRITGIGAHELGTVFTMTTGNTTISASAMTYVQQSLANSRASRAAKNAAAALYAYYEAAIAYRGNNN